EGGYTYGGLGGGLSVTAPSMAVDGQFLGNTITGAGQTFTPPTPSSLPLAFQQQALIPNLLFPPISPTPPNVTFGPATFAPAAPLSLDDSGMPLAIREDRIANVILSPDLINVDGFGIFKIDNSDGTITVPANVTPSAPPRGSITMSGANIDIEGALFARGGTLSFNVFDISPYIVALNGGVPLLVPPPPDPSRGLFTLGGGATLGAAGLIIDQRPVPGAMSDSPLVIDGGAVSINAYSANLHAGSKIDVSGGVDVSATGAIAYGSAGTINIRSGQDPLIPAVLGGQLNLGAKLSGFSGGKGGSLSILAPFIQVGGTTSDANTLLFTPEFFNQGGFDTFTLAGIGAPNIGEDLTVPPAVLIAPGTLIRPVVESFLADLSGTPGHSLTLAKTVLPVGVRAPFSLNLVASGVVDLANAPIIRGDFVMGDRSLIQTDPDGSVSISANTVAVLGSIIAPGGTISISGSSKPGLLFIDTSNAQPTVDLGPNSLLSAAGATRLVPNALGFRTGTVLPGGQITV